MIKNAPLFWKIERKKGDRCDEGGEQQVKVTLVDKDKRDHSVNGTVLDKGTGHYELSFTPPSPGTYELHVTIKNKANFHCSWLLVLV